MKTSGFLNLDWNDLGKGLVMAVGGAVVGPIVEMLNKGQWNFDLTTSWHTAVAATIVYLFKNLLTPASIVTPAAKP